MRRVSVGQLGGIGITEERLRRIEDALREIERATYVGDVGDLPTTLTDPGADRILFWDVSVKKFAFLTLTGLSITDTTLALSGPVQLPSYAVADIPAATTAGQMIFVTDETGGAVPAFSDGTDWRRCTDRAVVS